MADSPELEGIRLHNRIRHLRLHTPVCVPMHVSEGHAGRWYLWYAWRPVRLDDPAGKTVWLRWVLRRTFFAAPWFCVPCWEEYRMATC